MNWTTVLTCLIDLIDFFICLWQHYCALPVNGAVVIYNHESVIFCSSFIIILTTFVSVTSGTLFYYLVIYIGNGKQWFSFRFLDWYKWTLKRCKRGKLFLHHKSDKVFLLIIIKTVAVIASCKLNVITS